MILFEFYDKAPDNVQDLDSDKSQLKWGEGRKTQKLTLGMINKIRRMKEVRSFEEAQQLKKIRNQYGQQQNQPPM